MQSEIQQRHSSASKANRANATVNEDIGTIMETMLYEYEATNVNQDLGRWDVSSVTSMLYMFNIATAFIPLSTSPVVSLAKDGV